jgi:uncharacterized protein YbjT (DUF2867 family)
MKIAVAGATGRLGTHVVDVLTERGHDVVPISRRHGVDLLTRDGLDAALSGVECIVDAASTPSTDKDEGTDYFVTATTNLHEAGTRATVERMIAVSIIGIDGFTGGYSAAKLAHERVALAGPIPTRILRAAQFHEFIGVLMDWGTQGDVAYVPKFRIQPVAARSVAEVLADIATADDFVPDAAGRSFAEVAGPREERFDALATLIASRPGDRRTVQPVSNPTDHDGVLSEQGALLPSPHAILTGPTFEEWLE